MTLPASIGSTAQWPAALSDYPGPWLISGNLWAIFPDTTNNVLRAWESTDGGNTWSNVGGSGPAINSTSVSRKNCFTAMNTTWSTAQIFATYSTPSGPAAVSAFDTSTNTWGSATVFSNNFMSFADSTGQFHCSLLVTSNGSLVLAGGNEPSSGDRVGFQAYNGSLGSYYFVHTGSTTDDFNSVNYCLRAVVLGTSDRIHLFYSDSTQSTVQHRSATLSGNTPTFDTVVTSFGSGFPQTAKYPVGQPYYDGSSVYVPYVGTGGARYAHATSGTNPTWTDVAEDQDASVVDTSNTMGAFWVSASKKYYFTISSATFGTNRLWVANDQGSGSWTAPVSFQTANPILAVALGPGSSAPKIGVLYSNNGTVTYAELIPTTSLTRSVSVVVTPAATTGRHALLQRTTTPSITPATTIAAVRRLSRPATVNTTIAAPAAKTANLSRPVTAVTSPAAVVTVRKAILRTATLALAPVATATGSHGSAVVVQAQVVPAAATAFLRSVFAAPTFTVAPNPSASRRAAINRLAAALLTPAAGGSRQRSVPRAGAMLSPPGASALTRQALTHASSAQVLPSPTALRVRTTPRSAGLNVGAAAAGAGRQAATRAPLGIVPPGSFPAQTLALQRNATGAVAAVASVVRLHILPRSATAVASPTTTALSLRNIPRLPLASILVSITAGRTLAHGAAASAASVASAAPGRAVHAKRSAPVNATPAAVAGRALAQFRRLTALTAAAAASSRERGLPRPAAVNTVPLASAAQQGASRRAAAAATAPLPSLTRLLAQLRTVAASVSPHDQTANGTPHTAAAAASVSPTATAAPLQGIARAGAASVSPSDARSLAQQVVRTVLESILPQVGVGSSRGLPRSLTDATSPTAATSQRNDMARNPVATGTPSAAPTSLQTLLRVLSLRTPPAPLAAAQQGLGRATTATIAATAAGAATPGLHASVSTTPADAVARLQTIGRAAAASVVSAAYAPRHLTSTAVASVASVALANLGFRRSGAAAATAAATALRLRSLPRLLTMAILPQAQGARLRDFLLSIAGAGASVFVLKPLHHLDLLVSGIAGPTFGLRRLLAGEGVFAATGSFVAQASLQVAMALAPAGSAALALLPVRNLAGSGALASALGLTANGGLVWDALAALGIVPALAAIGGATYTAGGALVTSASLGANAEPIPAGVTTYNRTFTILPHLLQSEWLADAAVTHGVSLTVRSAGGDAQIHASPVIHLIDTWTPRDTWAIIPPGPVVRGMTLSLGTSFLAQQVTLRPAAVSPALLPFYVGDSLPAIQVRFLQNGAPYNLTGASVSLSVSLDGTSQSTTRAATVLDAAGGLAQHDWAGPFVVAGSYSAQWTITTASRQVIKAKPFTITTKRSL